MSSVESLQDRLDKLPAGETLTLDPPGREFKGPLSIRRAARIDGQGGTIWAANGPVLQIEAPGVVLANLNVEVTSRDAPPDGEGACALVVRQGLAVALEQVAVRGNVLGLDDEEGAWRYPRSVALGAIQAAVGHEFRVHLEVPVACTLESEIDGLQILPHTLPAGAATVALRLEALPTGTRLRGLLLLRTGRLLRRLAVTGHATDGGAVGNGQIVWQPDGGAVPLPPGSAPLPSPRTTPAAPASVPAADSSRVASTTAGPLVVSADGPFHTIGEAVRHAPPGGRILVKAGVYAECLTLTKKVEIVGDGAADVIVEGVDGNCIRLQADMARVRGLTLRGAAKQNNREFYAVSAPHGQLILEDCRISSDTLACVAAFGPSSRPVLRRCRITAGASVGVLAGDKAEVVLEDCEISGQAATGVEARRGARVTLRTCKINDCTQAGVLVHEQGEVTLEDCELVGHGQTGVEVRDNGQAMLKRCKVLRSKGPGVRILGAAVTLEDCELAENALANLEVRHAGNPTLRRCKLHHGKSTGVRFGRDAGGLLEDCDLFANARAAVEIVQNANPTLKRCTVRDNTAVGVAVFDRGRGLFEDCDFSEADQAVLEIRQSAAPVLRRCKIHDGKRAGVLVASRGAGELEECEVYANRGPGVAVTADANPILKRCQLRDNDHAGVVVWDGGRGRFERCTISANGLAGVAILANGAPTVKGCTVTRNKDAGVWGQRNAEGEIEECDFAGNRGDPLELESGASCKVGKNRLGT